jgi:hypothetical protein
MIKGAARSNQHTRSALVLASDAKRLGRSGREAIPAAEEINERNLRRPIDPMELKGADVD